MHFGEYELSLSLIGLSPLPTAHPKAFQRLPVRPSIPLHRDFGLAMGRSQSFASAPADSRPVKARFRSGSAPEGLTLAGWEQLVGSLCKRHGVTNECSARLQAHGFRIYFTPLFGVLFTFPSRYWYAIGLPGVFSLARRSARIQAGFHVPRPTQGTAQAHIFGARGCHPLWPRFPALFLHRYTP